MISRISPNGYKKMTLESMSFALSIISVNGDPINLGVNIPCDDNTDTVNLSNDNYERKNFNFYHPLTDWNKSNPGGVHYDINGNIIADTKDAYDLTVNKIEITEDIWDAHEWNPFISGLGVTSHREPEDRKKHPYGKYVLAYYQDENASPKPTWADIQEIYFLWRRQWYELTDKHWGRIDEYLSDSRKEVVSASVVHSIHDEPIHTGAGLEHMPSMIYLSSHENSAGNAPQPACLRIENGTEEVELWTQGEKNELLDTLATKTNLAESARNIIHNRIVNKLEESKDATKTLDDRVAALDAYIDALQHETLDKSIADEMQRLNSSDSLPDDVGRAKTVLIERLETHATGYQKHLKGAISQQAIDNWAACIDMDKALAEVAKQCVLGTIDIERALDVEDARGAYKSGVRAINAITAANTPHWTILWDDNSKDVDDPFPVLADRIPGRVVTVRARHPEGLETPIPGNCSINALPVAHDESTGNRVPISPTLQSVNEPDGAYQVKLTLPETITEPVIVTINSRNLCGPSRIKVIMVPPQSTP